MVAPKLQKRLDALRYVPLQAFCQNVRHEFGPVFSQPNSCSIEQYQFMKLVIFFSGSSRRVDTVLKRESANALRVFKKQTGVDPRIVWSETDEIADRKKWTSEAVKDVLKTNRGADTHLVGLLEIHSAIQDEIYDVDRSTLDRVTGMAAEDAKAYIEDTIERREYKYSPTNPDFKPDMVKVQNLIMRDYLGLFTQPHDYKGVFLCDQITKLMGPGMSGWRLIRYLGGGAYGKVFQMQTPTGDVVAVKFMVEQHPGEALDEVRAQREFNRLGLAPRVVDHKVIQTLSGVKMNVIVMGRIDMTMEEMLCVARDDTTKIQQVADDVVEILTRMRRAGVTHGDMHTQNFAYQIRDGGYVPVLIDFGQSTTRLNNTLVDAEQLLRTLTYRGLGFTYPYSYIIAEALQKYLTRIGITHRLTGDDDVQGRIWEKYMDLRESVRHRLALELSELELSQKTRRGSRKKRKKSRKRRTGAVQKSHDDDLIRQLM